jgi:hypothetical protein
MNEDSPIKSSVALGCKIWEGRTLNLHSGSIGRIRLYTGSGTNTCMSEKQKRRSNACKLEMVNQNSTRKKNSIEKKAVYNHFPISRCCRVTNATPALCYLSKNAKNQ